MKEIIIGSGIAILILSLILSDFFRKWFHNSGMLSDPPTPEEKTCKVLSEKYHSLSKGERYLDETFSVEKYQDFSETAGKYRQLFSEKHLYYENKLQNALSLAPNECEAILQEYEDEIDVLKEELFSKIEDAAMVYDEITGGLFAPKFTNLERRKKTYEKCIDCLEKLILRFTAPDYSHRHIYGVHSTPLNIQNCEQWGKYIEEYRLKIERINEEISLFTNQDKN